MSLAQQVFQACKNGNLQQLTTLLSSGATVDYIDSDGTTPLYWACSYTNPDAISMVYLVLNAGSDYHINQQNTATGETALHRAVTLQGLNFPSFKIVSQLLDASANVNVLDTSYQTPLMGACSSFYPYAETTTQLLLDAGAEVQHIDNNFNTAYDRVLTVLRNEQAALRANGNPNTSTRVTEACNIQLNALLTVLRSGR